MTRAQTVALVLLALGCADRLDAQIAESRTADYLFVSTVEDARALWLNPAGLPIGAFASLMGEIVLERTDQDDRRVGQWTVGLGTRGLSLGYQRDRNEDGPATQAVRIGFGTPFPRGALGAATTFYKSDETSRGLDIGLRYFPARFLQVGAVVRHIGRPRILESRLPVTGVAGLSWTGLGSRLTIAGEAAAAERLDDSGFDVGYRAGATLSTPTRLPIAGLVAIAMNDGFGLERWTVGISVGGDRRGIALGTVRRDGGASTLDRLSLTGVALNRSPSRLRR